MGKIRINGREITGDQVALGNKTGGSLVQSGRGSQVALGNVTAGDLIQTSDGDEDDD